MYDEEWMVDLQNGSITPNSTNLLFGYIKRPISGFATGYPIV